MKRKRVDDTTDETEGISVKQQRVRYKLKADVAKLRHAFKVAKGFERQKLGRRSKDAAAGKGSRDEKKVEAEIAALRGLDIDASAEHHLRKTLLRDKTVAQHPDLPPEVHELGNLPTDGPTLNVNARLCNSNPVQAALKDAVEDVRRALGVKDDGSKVLKKKRRRAKDFSIDGGATTVSKAEPKKSSNEQSQAPPATDRLDDGDESDGLSNYDEYADRLASESGDDDEVDGESTNVAALERQLAQEGIRDHQTSSNPRSYNLRDDLSFTESEPPSPSASPEPRKSARATTTKTSFIPSLTMGGYISGSGSDIEEVDVAPKRNRRGQRARQQIWEQKFGAKAKHLQNSSRDQGWDRKRGAVDDRGRGKQRGIDGRARRANPDYGIGANDHAAPTGRTKAEDLKKERKKDEDRPVHPSWEAAKKAKEKREAPVAFAGVKTTFD